MVRLPVVVTVPTAPLAFWVGGWSALQVLRSDAAHQPRRRNRLLLSLGHPNRTKSIVEGIVEPHRTKPIDEDDDADLRIRVASRRTGGSVRVQCSSRPKPCAGGHSGLRLNTRTLACDPMREISIITGRGLHSDAGRSVLRQVVTDHAHSLGFLCESAHDNAGVLLVRVQGSTE
jgi:hypothetical protein